MEQPSAERPRRDFDPRSPLKSFFWATRYMLLEPERFFRVTRGGGHGPPTLYLLAALLVVGAISALFLLLFLLLAGIPLAREEGFATTAGTLAVAVVVLVAFFLIGLPLLGALFAFLGALYWHPFVALSVGIGQGAGFRETYRVTAYANGLTQLASLPASFVPLVGPLLALGLAMYVGIFGIKGAHGTTTARAVVSVVVPSILGFLILVGLVAGFLFFLDSRGAFDQASSVL